MGAEYVIYTEIKAKDGTWKPVGISRPRTKHEKFADVPQITTVYSYIHYTCSDGSWLKDYINRKTEDFDLNTYFSFFELDEDTAKDIKTEWFDHAPVYAATVAELATIILMIKNTRSKYYQTLKKIFDLAVCTAAQYDDVYRDYTHSVPTDAYNSNNVRVVLLESY